jgi:hypothetical protein
LPDEKPAHTVEIPASLGRDIDKGKLPAEGMPLEEVLHPKTVEMLHKQAGEPEPIRADQLRPISAAEAAAKRTFDGSTLPNMPRPRRVIPAPFQRSRVRGGQHGKRWVEIMAGEIEEDAMHEGVGRVADRKLDMINGKITLIGKGGMVQTFELGQVTKVFR